MLGRHEVWYGCGGRCRGHVKLLLMPVLWYRWRSDTAAHLRRWSAAVVAVVWKHGWWDYIYGKVVPQVDVLLLLLLVVVLVMTLILLLVVMLL